MNTERLMEIALEMAGLDEIPGDSAVHHPGRGIRRLLAGIDLRAPELALAKGLGYDAVLTHHPVGVATLNFHRVLERHVDQMIAAGVPRAVARAAVDETAEARRVLDSMTNYDHDPSIARLLDMPYLNIHTPLDEIGRRRMADAAASSARRQHGRRPRAATHGDVRRVPLRRHPRRGPRREGDASARPRRRIPRRRNERRLPRRQGVLRARRSTPSSTSTAVPTTPAASRPSSARRSRSW